MQKDVLILIMECCEAALTRMKNSLTGNDQLLEASTALHTIIGICGGAVKMADPAEKKQEETSSHAPTS